MGQWLIRTCVVIILATVAVGLHTQAPLITSVCPHLERNQHNRAAPENCASPDVLVVRSIRDLWLGTGAVIHGNRDDINALSTIAIAIFTCTLWWVTWGMVRIAKEQRADVLRSIKASEITANAAMKSADVAERALMGLERPMMFIQISPAPVKWSIERRKPNIPFPDLQYKFTNYGKTPAIIRHWGIEIDIHLIPISALPPIIQTHTLFQPVIKENCEISTRKISPRFSSGDETIESVHRGIWAPYLHGYIVYDDVFGYTHTTYFVWMYDRRIDCMVEEGGKKYNHTRTDPPAGPAPA
jgi:hypothetical protein